MPDSVSNGTFIAYLADDADRKAITYNGGWGHFTSATSVGLNETYLDTASEGQIGATASMTFTGSIVAGVAALPLNLTDPIVRSPPNVSVSIDGSTPETLSVPPTALDFFYKNKNLNVGKHTITITVLEETDDWPFVLDYLVYGGPDDVTVPIGATQQVADDGSDADTAGFLQGLLPQIEKAQQSKSDSVPVGPIVGGVIGGIALLTLISLVVWYLFIRPRRRGGRPFFYAPAKISDVLSSEIDAKPDPYPLLQPTNGQAGPISQVPSLAPTRRPTFAQSEISLEQGPPESSLGYGVGMGMSMGSGGSSSAKPPLSKAEMAGALSPPPPATYHSDSGIRFTGAGAGPSAGTSAVEGLSEVPPTYSEK
ncbi:hypothetical protein C8Q77DRAFT_600214 [Trametes polyzona]|nr:hypothetical protein C8Q77DRAFT_600214 [Trametes polyzona]